jgi:hypothetical protein
LEQSSSAGAELSTAQLHKQMEALLTINHHQAIAVSGSVGSSTSAQEWSVNSLSPAQ